MTFVPESCLKWKAPVKMGKLHNCGATWICCLPYHYSRGKTRYHLAGVTVAAISPPTSHGLRLLRDPWLNFDLLWAIALLVAGFVVLFF